MIEHVWHATITEMINVENRRRDAVAEFAPVSTHGGQRRTPMTVDQAYFAVIGNLDRSGGRPARMEGEMRSSLWEEGKLVLMREEK